MKTEAEVPEEDQRAVAEIVAKASKQGQIKSIVYEIEPIEVESNSRNVSCMAGLQTITIEIDEHTREHWEEIERRRVDNSGLSFPCGAALIPKV